VQFEAQGKVQSTVEFTYVSYMFVILLVGVKLNHIVMEKDFHLNYVVSYTLGYAYLSSVK
jgi:hypothetical protein